MAKSSLKIGEIPDVDQGITPNIKSNFRRDAYQVLCVNNKFN